MGERSASRNIYQLRSINDRAEVVAPVLPLSNGYISQKKYLQADLDSDFCPVLTSQVFHQVVQLRTLHTTPLSTLSFVSGHSCVLSNWLLLDPVSLKKD